jgi:hypothetical protein
MMKRTASRGIFAGGQSWTLSRLAAARFGSEAITQSRTPQWNLPTRAIKGSERVESPHEPSAASCPVDFAGGVVFDYLPTGNHSEKAGRNLEF